MAGFLIHPVMMWDEILNEKELLISMKKIFLITFALILTGCGSFGGSIPLAEDNGLPPSPTATALPVFTPTPVPSGPCDNPLVPLGANHQWQYRVIDDLNQSIFNLKVLGRRDAANIVTMVEFTDVRQATSLQEPVVCLEGAIEDFPLFMESMLFSGYLSKVLDTYQDKGVYAPAHRELEASQWVMDWKADYLIEESVFLKNPMGGSDLSILESTPVDISFQSTGIREPVSVPAGEFPQALKVLHEFALFVSLTIQGGATTGTLRVKVNQWYEPYIGLVKAEIESVALDMGLVDMPVPFESRLELEIFTP